MNTILQRYKFPADMQGTYGFILKHKTDLNYRINKKQRI